MSFGTDFEIPRAIEQQAVAPMDTTPTARDKVICKDGRVFHACEICRKRRSRCDGSKPQCTSCQKRGLRCEYRAMRKRGRHGKKSAAHTADDLSPVDTTRVNTSWSMAPQEGHRKSMGALNILDSLPRFLSSMADDQRRSMDSVIGAMASPVPRELAPHQAGAVDAFGRGMMVFHDSHAAQNQHGSHQVPLTHGNALAAAMSPVHSALPHSMVRSPSAVNAATSAASSAAAAAAVLSSAFLESIDPQHQNQHNYHQQHQQQQYMQRQQPYHQQQHYQQQQQQQQQHAQYQQQRHAVFLGSTASPPPINFRSMSVASSVFESPGMVPIHPSTVASAPSLSMAAAAAAAAAAALGSPIGTMMSPTSAPIHASSMGSTLSQYPSQPAFVYGRSSSGVQQLVTAPAIQRSLSVSTTAAHNALSNASDPATAAAAAAAAVAAAAVAAFQFSPGPTPIQTTAMSGVCASATTATITPAPLSAPIGMAADASQNSMAVDNDDDAGGRGAAHNGDGANVASNNSRAAQEDPHAQGTSATDARDTNVGMSKAERAKRAESRAWASVEAAATGARPRRHGRKRNINDKDRWNSNMVDEEQVLDSLDAEGADNFGRPLFDISTYPLPAEGDLDEQMNGMFEYFYMGVQTLHEPTFRKRVKSGSVSPVLIYAIMAVASRYSRRPSLHSLNGKAFLNGDRHASTACGLASIQLNHGDMGTVDTIHAMLFLSVYFMGQGNMLKSRMYLVKAVCTARTMGFHNMDATFVSSNPIFAFSGAFDRPHDLAPNLPNACSCPRTVEDLVQLETKRRIWWFLVFVDYFTANVMNVPVEIPSDSYCVRLPCSDEEWMSHTLTMGEPRRGLHAGDATGGGGGGGGGPMQGYSPPLPDSGDIPNAAPRDLGFGDRVSSAQQSVEYLRLNGFHDCRPPWLYHPGAFYLERLMIEFCDHLRRLNNLRSLAIRSFFHVDPVFVEESYPYLKRRRQSNSWAERLEKVKASWSWLHLQLNKWLDSILLRFSEVINRVPQDQYNRQYRHQYYYYLIAAHATIIMSHGVVLQLFTDFSRYVRQQQEQEQLYQQQGPHRTQSNTPMPSAPGASATAAWASPGAQTPPVDHAATGGIGGLVSGMSLSEGLSEFAIGNLGSAMAPLMNLAQGLAANGSHGGSSVHGSSIYGSVIGSPVSGGHGGFDEMMDLGLGLGSTSGAATASAALSIMRDLSDMASIAWDGCVSTAEQLASILRGKHPKFVLLGSPPLDVFREQVLSGDANILSQPGSAFNAPGTGPGADNPILSDPDFYMRLQPSTAWWMFLVAQVQVGHIKRLLKESEGSFKVSAKRKAYAAKAAAAKAAKAAAEANGSEQPTATAAPATGDVGAEQGEDILGIGQRLQKPADQMRPLSASVNNSAVMLATAVHLSNAAPAPPNRVALDKRAAIKARASRMVRAYENLSCMVKVLEGMQQYWQCMDYVSAIQDFLKGSEHPLH